MNIRVMLQIFPNRAQLLLCADLSNLLVLSAISGELVCENKKKKIKSKHHIKPDGQKR